MCALFDMIKQMIKNLNPHFKKKNKHFHLLTLDI